MAKKEKKLEKGQVACINPKCGKVNHMARRVCEFCGELTKAGLSAKAKAEAKATAPTEAPPAKQRKATAPTEEEIVIAVEGRSALSVIAALVKAAQQVGGVDTAIAVLREFGD
jgi:uncharacterized OB-fold protein